MTHLNADCGAFSCKSKSRRTNCIKSAGSGKRMASRFLCQICGNSVSFRSFDRSKPGKKRKCFVVGRKSCKKLSKNKIAAFWHFAVDQVVANHGHRPLRPTAPDRFLEAGQIFGEPAGRIMHFGLLGENGCIDNGCICN